MSEKGMGSSVLRKEDFRFITGRGKYTDDINHSNQLHAYFLRSPIAHANLISVDIESAKSCPGVVAIYTSKDIDASLPCGWEAPTKPGTPPMHEPPWPVFAKNKIRFVGEMIAVVIAETVNQAKDACDLINIEYEDLPAVVSPKKAIEDDAPQIWNDIPNNVCFEWELGNKEETEKAFKEAEQSGHQGFTLAGSHLSNPPLMKCNTAQ